MRTDFSELGISVLTLNPGWGKTDMGGPDVRSTVEEAIQNMAKWIAEFRPTDSGTFLDIDGETAPW